MFDSKDIFWLGGRKYSGFPPKVPTNHIYWDSTLVASMVNIGIRLRPVEHSTHFVN